MVNPLELTGQTILVTGASSGLGRQIAILFSQLGARVVLVARNEARLKETLQQMDGEGHYIEIRDLADTYGIPAWLETVAESVGPLNGLIHSAGILRSKALRYLECDEISFTLRTNLESAFALAKGFRQRMVHTQPASLVFLASTAGLVGLSGGSDYAASKGGLIALARSLAIELVRERVRVNCIAPAWIETEMTMTAMKNFNPAQYEDLRQKHLLGFGQPMDVAHAAAFLTAKTGRWITGTTLVVDGGYTCQ